MTAVPGAARRLVPSYAVAGGRTQPAGEHLPVEAMLTTTGSGLGVVVDLQFERRDAVLLCRRPQSVAELAARLRLPIGVARVLAADLLAEGYLTVDRPPAEGTADVAVLERLLTGLRAAV